MCLQSDGSIFEQESEINSLTWNSLRDFSNENENSPLTIYTYEKNEQVGNETKTIDVDVNISSGEFLYGGKKGWQYGIWKGALNKVPFSEENLLKFREDNSENISTEEFEKLKNSSQNTSIESLTANNTNHYEDNIHFYAVQKNETDEQDIASEKVAIETESEGGRYRLVNSNSDISYEIDYDNVLVGNIAVDSKIVRVNGKRTVQNNYYMPFICGNKIHGDRAGGSAYYSLVSVESETSHAASSNAFNMPYVSRTQTDGHDYTPSANVNFGFGELSEVLKFAEGDFTKSAFSNSIGTSLNRGWNNSETKTVQSVQDMNGDGLPDIVVNEGSNINVITSDKTNGTISFKGKNSFTGIDGISKTKTDVDVYGGSVSASGNVSVEGKHVKLNTAGGGGGVTYTNGTSSVNAGFIDINGDGLADYFNGDSFLMNTGSSFAANSLVFFDSDCINKSTSNNFGMNASITVGTGAGDDQYTATKLATGAGATVGISYSASSSNTEFMMIDLNGDGLQDKLSMSPGSENFSVQYNLGTSFSDSHTITLPKWNTAEKPENFLTQSDSAGFDMGLIGLIPYVGPAVEKGLSSISINPYGFEAEKYANSLDWSSSISFGLSGSVNFNVNVDIYVVAGFINVTASGGGGSNFNTSINGISVKMMDMNGDGLPDHVMRIPGYATYWKKNMMGRANLLNRIELPQGGSVEIGYDEKLGDVQDPNFRYVMSSVTMDDGCGQTVDAIAHGKHSVTTNFDYKYGYYDREMKDFYGFGTVKTIYADGSVKKDDYYNDKYYSKGMLKKSTLMASDGFVYSENENEICDEPVALVKTETSRIYERVGDGSCIEKTSAYFYDDYGNCTYIEQSGSGKTLRAQIVYDNSRLGTYVIGLPKDIKVYDGSGRLLRHRSGKYDADGQLTELWQYYTNTAHTSNYLSYDDYGNIASVKDGRGATLSYDYDGEENMFVTEVSQKGNGTGTYRSTLTYDMSAQTKLSEKDCRGNEMRYEYDNWQRPSKIWTSYDTGTVPAVSYEYSTPKAGTDGSHSLWHAVTNNKVTFDSADSSIIQTVVQIDGLGRAVRTAKTGFVNGNNGWNVSGAIEYDSKGRSIKEGMTEFVAGSFSELLLETPCMGELFTRYEYDEQDRKVKTVLPDGSVQKTDFSVEGEKLSTKTTDPMGNISLQEIDSFENIVRTEKFDMQGNSLTHVTYSYNAIGEMLEVRDAKDNPIKVSYDMLGRKTMLESLDSGRYEYEYDEVGNLKSESNSVLRKKGKKIAYEYDGLNRLTKIDYPETADTVYVYGDENSGLAAGKILSVTDASGTMEYEYGRLGEVTKETRTLTSHVGHSQTSQQAVMEYRSDYLGRIQWIVYPDGEKITYGYDMGGQVVSVTGEHYGQEFVYVTNILYDQYGQRTRIEYGNGTSTAYEYDPARRWLSSIRTENSRGRTFQNISYSFDRVGNVLGYENDCLDSVTGNYRTSQSYAYDSLYQLIRVDGSTTYNPYMSPIAEYISTYSQSFTFDDKGLGNMMSKVSTETVNPRKAIGNELNYSFDNVYDENYAHRVIRSGDRYYQYDENGNIIIEQDGQIEEEPVTYHRVTEETEGVYGMDYGWGLFREKSGESKTSARSFRRTYTWNERNQLIASSDNAVSVAYTYGQDGQRSNKYTANSETLYFNKMWTLHVDSGNSYYGGQNAKNIYLGETRIVTKLAGAKETTAHEETYKQYYYHSDHLGSASLISDYKGDEYQRIEYTPYGETWVEKTSNTGDAFLPYKFTAKEQDEETGLYYYGARYLDPKYSRWLSTDPALGDYIPQAPISDEARKNNQNLSGMGGIFNHINCNLYAYGANNPVHYIDPDGNQSLPCISPREFFSFIC
ncbi:MAG: toxin TcdB middle/N-terminal domain-containing protein, partial [Treponemataceae bacterium]|nr:toxin TcdB middle/N-terminal domain-containing protein [Treponemataceae bacterium]